MAPIIANVDAILDSVPKPGFSATTIFVSASLLALLILAAIIGCMIKCAEYEDENEWDDGDEDEEADTEYVEGNYRDYQDYQADNEYSDDEEYYNSVYHDEKVSSLAPRHGVYRRWEE